MPRNEISIFLASPLEMEKDRVYIGSHAGLLNTYYRGAGKFITINKWEDYRSSYMGVRTQTEYNEELIRPSDSVIVLLHTKVGSYTIEEFEKAADWNKDIIVALKVDATVGYKVPQEVAEFVDRIKSISSFKGCWIYSSKDDLISYVDKYICSELGDYEEVGVDVKSDYCCYISATRQLQYGCEELRDRIRAFDTSSKLQYGNRCLLLPFNNIKNIGISNYNYCLYFEEPEADVYAQADLMFEQANSNHVPYYNCKFYEDDNYQARLFDKYHDGLFPKCIGIKPLKNMDDEIELSHLCEAVISEMKELQVRYYLLNVSRPAFMSRDGKFYVNNIEVHPDKSVVSLIGTAEINRAKKLDVYAAAIEFEDRKQKAKILAEEQARSFRAILETKYSSLIRISNIVENIIADFSVLDEVYEGLWENKNYEELISRIKFNFVKLTAYSKNHKDESAISTEVKLGLCNLKIKAIFKYEGKNNFSNLLLALFRERLTLTRCLYNKNVIDHSDVVISYALLAIYESQTNRTNYRKTIKDFFSFIDNHNFEDVLIDCDFRFDYANWLRLNKEYDRANYHIDIGVKKLTRDAVANKIFDYRLGDTIFQIISDYLNYRLHLDSVKRWLQYWKEALLASNDESVLWKLSYLMMLAAELRTLNPNSSSDDKIGYDRINREVNRLYNEALSVWFILDDAMKIDLAYTANIFADFYADRIGDVANKEYHKSQSLFFLTTAENILKSVGQKNIVAALPFLAQTYHNLGWLKDHIGEENEVRNYYEAAYKIRRAIYIAQHDRHSGELLAETETNLAAFIAKDDEEWALELCREAEILYTKYCQREVDECVVNLMKVRQLRGTIYFDNPKLKTRGLELLSEVWNWVSEHPDNSYLSTFVSHSLRILISVGLIKIEVENGRAYVNLKDGRLYFN